MKTQRRRRSVDGLSARQRSVQRRARQMSFRPAVWLAADALFGFTHRATNAKALWCETVRVWLGRTTFLDWAMDESDINIPRIVHKSTGAPDALDELQKAVREELMAYWADHLTSLPRKSTRAWLPLP